MDDVFKFQMVDYFHTIDGSMPIVKSQPEIV